MNKLKWITQCFSQPYEIQKSMFPDLINVADQLAVEWELAMDEVDDSRLTDDQMQVIKALDDYMLSISGPANLKYWNDDALRHSNEWDNMRLLAKAILDNMVWDNTAHT
ncbi:hypothetical protein [Dickeya oryzae]